MGKLILDTTSSTSIIFSYIAKRGIEGRRRMVFHEETVPGVGSGLIEILSRRTYRSLASAIRELVSNAYDADAKHFNMSLSETLDGNKKVYKLTFFDDGDGMDHEEFKTYLQVASPGRRIRTGQDATKRLFRPIIGMMGIGSLAVAPWADRVEILSKKPGENEVLHVQIPYQKFFDKPQILDKELASEYKYQVRTFVSPTMDNNERERGFTIIDLVDLTEEARNELFNGQDWKPSDPLKAVQLGLVGDDYRSHLSSSRNRTRTSFGVFPPLTAFLNRLCLMIPVPYPADAPLRHPPMAAFFRSLQAYFIDEVTFQGVACHRATTILDQQTITDVNTAQSALVDPKDDRDLGRDEFCAVRQISQTLPQTHIIVRGYIACQNTATRFLDLNGIQVRIKGVGIGSYKYDLLTNPRSQTASARGIRREAISGEIFVEEAPALDRALSGDRESFYDGSEVFRELQEVVATAAKEVMDEVDARKRNYEQYQRTAAAAAAAVTPASPILGSPPATQEEASNNQDPAELDTAAETRDLPPEPVENSSAQMPDGVSTTEDTQPRSVDPQVTSGTLPPTSSTSSNLATTRSSSMKETRVATSLDNIERMRASLLAIAHVGDTEVYVRNEVVPPSLSPDLIERMCRAATQSATEVARNIDSGPPIDIAVLLSEEVE